LFCLSILLVALFEVISTGNADGNQPKSTFSEFVNQTGYDWHISAGPVEVNVNVFLRNIYKVDDVNMEYGVQLNLRQSWTDKRLANDLLVNNSKGFIVLAEDQKIWKPDTFIQNEKHAKRHSFDKPNELIRVYNDGRVLYSTRVSLVLGCPMRLKRYPHDIQTCEIVLASYSYTDDEISYKWRSTDAIQVNERISDSMANFRFRDVTTEQCDTTTNTGAYSCIKAKITLKRESGHLLVHLYMPFVLLVAVAYLSFWFDRKAVTARLVLCLTTLLAMFFHTAKVNKKVTSECCTSLDIWCGVCLAFVFWSLLEFVFVNYVGATTTEHNYTQIKNEEETVGKSQGSKKLVNNAANKADYFSRILFPVFFLLFIVIYFLCFT